MAADSESLVFMTRVFNYRYFFAFLVEPESEVYHIMLSWAWKNAPRIWSDSESFLLVIVNQIKIFRFSYAQILQAVALTYQVWLQLSNSSSQEMWWHIYIEWDGLEEQD